MIAAFLALLPGFPIRQVSPAELSRLMGAWLLATLAVGIVAAVPTLPWLALMGLWFLVRWPSARSPLTGEADSTSVHASLITWAAIGLTWTLLRSIPANVLELVPWGWLVVAGAQSVLLAMFWWEKAPGAGGTRRSITDRYKGTFGSPVLTALYLALVAPFCPWWGWPLLAIGFWFTWSWLAFVGLGVGLGMLYPWTLWIFASVALLAALVWYLELERPGVVPHPGPWRRWLWIKGQPLMEWTPRGHSFDSVRARLLLWYLIPYHMPGHWLTGYGPFVFERDHRRWGSRYGLDVTNGEAHMEALQMLYEYGLIGVAAIVAFVLPILPHLRVGDPWSAAWVTGAVLSLGHWPCRHPALGVVWLTVSVGVMR